MGLLPGPHPEPEGATVALGGDEDHGPVADGVPEPGAAVHDRENPVEREKGLPDRGLAEEDGEAPDQKDAFDEPLGRRESGQPGGGEGAKWGRGNHALPGAGRDLSEEGAGHLRRAPLVGSRAVGAGWAGLRRQPPCECSRREAEGPADLLDRHLPTRGLGVDGGDLHAEQRGGFGWPKKLFHHGRSY